MKKKPHLLLWLGIIIPALSLYGCSGGSSSGEPDPVVIDPPAQEATIKVTDSNGSNCTSVSFTDDAESFSLNIQATDTWELKITYTPDWLHLSKSSGAAGNTTITLSVDANPDETTRSCTINVLLNSKNKGSIRVTQDKHVKLTLSELSTDAEVVHATGGTTKLTVNSGKSWTVEVTEGSGWVTAAPFSNNRELTIEAAENTGNSDRNATIVVKSGSEQQTISFTQRQNIIQRTPLYEQRIHSGVRLEHTGYHFTALRIVMPYPESNAYQDISNFNTPINAQVKTSSDGIHKYTLTTHTSNIPASGQEIANETFTATPYSVDINFNAITERIPYDENSDIYTRYTGTTYASSGEALIDPTEPRIVSIGDQLWSQSGGDIIEYARQCYNYVADSYGYLNPNTGIHPLKELLDNGGGDCGNLSSIYISLLRYKKIPARHIVMASPDDYYHVRAEFYLAGYDWIPVDVTWHQGNGGNYFGHHNGNLIVMNRDAGIPVNIDVADWVIDLLQTYAGFWWYSVEGSYSNWTHLFYRY